jgi:hypothetical protein
MSGMLNFLGGIGSVVSTSPHLIFLSPTPHTLTAASPEFLHHYPTMLNKPPPMSHSNIIMALNGMMPALDCNNPNDKAFKTARLFYDVHYFSCRDDIFHTIFCARSFPPPSSIFV